MSNMVQCPNCRQMVEKGNDFCIFCGTKMPAFAEPSSSGPDAPPAAGVARRCKNGHEFKDGSLVYCPICGLPFEEPGTPGREGDASPKTETGFIPEGMYTPTSEDLKPKRGNKA